MNKAIEVHKIRASYADTIKSINFYETALEVMKNNKTALYNSFIQIIRDHKYLTIGDIELERIDTNTRYIPYRTNLDNGYTLSVYVEVDTTDLSIRYGIRYFTNEDNLSEVGVFESLGLMYDSVFDYDQTVAIVKAISELGKV